MIVNDPLRAFPNPVPLNQQVVANKNGKKYTVISVIKDICAVIARIFNNIINFLKKIFGNNNQVVNPQVRVAPRPIVNPPVFQPNQQLKNAIRVIEGQDAPALVPKPEHAAHKELEQHPKYHGQFFTNEAVRRLRDLPVGSALLRFSPDLKQFFITRKEIRNNTVQFQSYPLGKMALNELMKVLGIKELVPRPTAQPVVFVQPAPAPKPMPVFVPMEQADELQLKNFAANKDNLSSADKLKVLKCLQQHLTKNQKDIAGYNNIMVTLKAAEHLIVNHDTWKKFIDLMRQGKVTQQQINKEIYSKLNCVAHPDSNNLVEALEGFPNAFIRGYLFAQEKGLIADFLKNALVGSDICLEARMKSILGWLESNTVEDTAIALNFDAKKDNYYQVMTKSLDPFKETQLRAYFNAEHKDKVKQYLFGVDQKSFFYTDSWTKLKLSLEGQEKFYTNYYTKPKFVEFLKANMTLPFKLEKVIENVNEITADNIGKLADGWIDISGVDPFDYADKKAQMIAQQKAAKPIKA